MKNSFGSLGLYGQFAIYGQKSRKDDTQLFSLCVVVTVIIAIVFGVIDTIPQHFWQ